eukprot:TRINITY_DN4138_c0_g1_i4.p1 TRINITY_DN4138_c0_g1~~TRINITY_DN4138_c0_g1_i4.p1  ORF type:complete len:699 (-),score=233.61 TRINITY_DN4138_c0_g1_i4:821-2917(-)
MKTVFANTCLLVLLSCAAAQTADTNPVAKALQLMTELSARITKDGEAELAAFREFELWCAGAKQEQGFEIEDAKVNIEEANAQISTGKSNADIAADKIESLAASITKNEADLADATSIRKKESDDFTAAEQELTNTVATLGRAVNILEDELKGSALLQTKVNGADKTALLSTLKQVIQAASFTANDRKTLMSLAQSDELDYQAPEVKAYDQQSNGILDVLQDLQEKAEKELVDLRAAEATAKHNFDMLATSLKDQLGVDNAELAEQKGLREQANSKRKVGEGDLAAAEKALATAEKTLKEATATCNENAKNREASVKSRAAEQEAIATAVKALEEYTPKAVQTLYAKGAPSFLQVHSIDSPADLRNMEVAEIIRNVAKNDHSAIMAQLSHVASQNARLGTKAFGKIIELIRGIIARIEEEAKNDNSHKEYCDAELAKTGRKSNKLELTMEKFQSRKDTDSAKLATTKGQIKKAQDTLVKLAEEQKKLDEIRADEKAAFENITRDVEFGLEGIRVAIKVLRDFYRTKAPALIQIKEHTNDKKLGQPETPIFHSKAGAEGSSIMGMLEVVESDMTKSLSTAKMEEDAAIREHRTLSQENREEKAMKTQDKVYNQKTQAELEKKLRDHDADLETTKLEVDATAKYQKQIEEACANNGPTYEQRKAAREQEITNLKDALKIINAKGEEALLQTVGKSLRGHK